MATGREVGPKLAEVASRRIKCEDCDCWNCGNSQVGTGECRFGPPLWVANLGYGVWPKTMDSHWCKRAVAKC